ncbi:glycosyltransferase involved in cell wall biosynthesis [Salinibacter ruber]|nr:glycosyltransferase involved in cell wall biosynthesis [Salinibacter ruber]
MDAAIDLRDVKEVVIHVRGSGELEESLQAEVERYKLSNVEFFDHCPLEQAAAHMAASDALLVPLADDPIFQKFIPSKLFDSMASGRPVLLSVDGEAREMPIRG